MVVTVTGASPVVVEVGAAGGVDHRAGDRGGARGAEEGDDVLIDAERGCWISENA